MTITQADIDFMWQTVIMPRVGDVYVFGGSLNPSAVNQGTDCSGAVSEAAEAMEYGPQMNWLRQFWTGTFAGANPGDTGPFSGVDLTSDWTCIASAAAAPAGAAMIVAVLQNPDPTQAHMVCQILDNNNVTGFGGPGKYVGIESGGSYTDANGNSTLHIGPEATSVTDPEFNQWFCTGPIAGEPTPAPAAFTPVNGVDFSGGFPGGAALAAAGYAFACRYVYDGSPDLPDKLLTKAEADDYLANGVAPVSNYESSGVDAMNGFAQGVTDAQDAQAHHAAAGGAPDRPIYFSLDWDEAPGDDSAVFAYFQGIASVIGLPRTGVYGGYWIIKRLLDAGLVTWAWQANAWSADPSGAAPLGPNQNYLDPRANILQFLGQAIVNGVQCDTDVAYTEDYGQWGYAPSTPTPGGFPMALTDDQQQQLLDAVLDNQTQLRGPNLQGWPQLGTNAAGDNLTLVDGLAAVIADVTTVVAPPVVTPTPTPNPVVVTSDVQPITITPSGVDSTLKAGIGFLGGVGAVGTWALEAFGGILSPTTATAISSALVIVAGLASKLVSLEQRVNAATGQTQTKLTVRGLGRK